MDDYFISKRMNLLGYHEVHNKYCPVLPKECDSDYLGAFNNYQLAVEKAKKYYHWVAGCKICTKLSSRMREQRLSLATNKKKAHL